MKLDLANKGLVKLDYTVLKEELKSIGIENENELKILILDSNSFNKLDGLEKLTNLINLSLANNQLIEIRQVGRLLNLEYLNLMSNSLTNLDCLKQLKHLTWLNVSGNQIRTIDCLKFNTSLQYIDASDNLIDHLSDLSALKGLKILNLTGNEIFTLESASDLLPQSISKLFLSSNAIDDLNEVCYLEPLENLLHLSINNNPCVSIGLDFESIFNYRPYVLNWCLNLKELDGVEISQKEFLKAEWLYSQGKGRYFSPGQHIQLVEYLIKNCPILSNESIQEEIRLSKILEKKELYSHELETNNSTSINKTVSNQHQPQQQQQKLSTPTPPANQDPIIEQQQKQQQENQQSNNQIQQEKKNLIDNIKLSSNESLHNLERRTDSEEMIYSEKSDTKSNNQNAYVDYENRPIKPLDPNAFYKQLSEFSELSSEELEKMKERVISRKIRAKTTETPVTKLTSQTRSQTKKPTRQQSYNSAQQNSSFSKQQQYAKNKQLGSNSGTLTANKTPNLSQHRRSKTQDELSSIAKIYSQQLRPQSSGISPKRQVSKFTSNITPNRLKQSKYSIKTATNTTNTANLLNRVDSFPMASRKIASPIQTISPSKPGQKKLINANGGKSRTMTETENELSLSSAPTKTRTRSNSGSSQPLTDTDSKLQQQSMTKMIQSTLREQLEKLQSKRNELRMAREKSFRELKNEARMMEEKKKEMSLYESLFTKTIQAPKVLTFEDRCAMKIQAAWRGYYCRNSKFIKPILMQLKCHKMFHQVVALRSNLQDLKNQHTHLTKFNSDSMSKLSQMIGMMFRPVEASVSRSELEIQARIEPLPMLSTNEKSVGFSQLILTQQLDLERENAELRLKCKQMEEKCRSLENKITSQKENYLKKSIPSENNNNNTSLGRLSDTTNTSTSKSNRQNEEPATGRQLQPKPDIYPPLKVRLQKLNERSVALKWNHNPKNSLIDLTGYNIYINDEMLATMKPIDKIASIDGMKEEGEYRIYIKSVCGQVESDLSNVVITRVKKKHSHVDVNKKGAVAKKPTDSDNAETDDDGGEEEEEENESPSKSSDEKRGGESIEKLLEKLKSNDEEDKSPRIKKKQVRQNVALENIFKTMPSSQQSGDDSIRGSNNAAAAPNTIPFQSNYQIESSSSFTVAGNPVVTNNSNQSKTSDNDKETKDGEKIAKKSDAQLKLGKKNSPAHNTSDTTVESHVKYSSNEPNFSKTLSTTSGSTGRGSPLRRSMSFSDSNEDSN